MTGFSQPTGGDGFPIAEHLEHLVIYAPKSYEKDVMTSFGEKDAVRADVVCVDCQEEFVDTLVFQGRIIGVTKNKVGELVLGRVGQVATRPGQNPAWILAPFSDADADRAIAVWDNRGDFGPDVDGGAAYEPEPEPEPVRRSVVRRPGDASSGGGKGRDVSALRAAAGARMGG